MASPIYTTAPMPVQLSSVDASDKTLTVVGGVVKSKDERIAELEGHRSQWRRVAFRLADALKAIAGHKREDGTPSAVAYGWLKSQAFVALEAADLDGVER